MLLNGSRERRHTVSQALLYLDFEVNVSLFCSQGVWLWRSQDTAHPTPANVVKIEPSKLSIENKKKNSINNFR